MTKRNPNRLCACCRLNQALVFVPTVMRPEHSIGYCFVCANAVSEAAKASGYRFATPATEVQA